MERILLWMIGFSWLYWAYACFLVRKHFGINSKDTIRASDQGRIPLDSRTLRDNFHSNYTRFPGSSSRYGGNREEGVFGHCTGLLPSPPVSILKPACGYDYEMYENFASFCEQDYGEYELIFGVESLDDPSVACVMRLRKSYPNLPIRLVIGQAHGANRKVCLLHSMVQHARHEILVISDSDIRVGPGYLRNVVDPLADPGVGLVTCPYFGDKALSLAGKMEALHMGALFLPSTLVAWRLGVSFALGATVALRRKDLDSIGGFQAIEDYLADDFQVGYRVASLGLRPVLSHYIVRSILGNVEFRNQWFREVRWARCQRTSRPREYPGVLLTLGTFLSALFWVWNFWIGNDATFSLSLAQDVLLYTLALRYSTAWLIADSIGDKEVKKSLYLLPFREFLSALVWLYGLFGRRIVWRGREYVLEQEGRMRALEEGADARCV